MCTVPFRSGSLFTVDDDDDDDDVERRTKKDSTEKMDAADNEKTSRPTQLNFLKGVVLFVALCA
jgi:hypothetical protein